MVEDLGTGEVTVKSEVPWDATGDGIIDQLDAQLRMVFEGRHGTRIALLKPTPLDRIVRSRRTDVVGDQVIMGDDIAFVGVVPEPAYVFDQLPGMVHQRIINGNHAAGAVAHCGITLQPLQPSIVHFLYMPRRPPKPPVLPCTTLFQ